jgi:hypothetical protein
LQFRDGPDVSSEFDWHSERNRKRAQKQLARYVERLGFQSLPNTGMYAVSLSHRLPSLKETDRQAKGIRFGFAAKPAETDTHLN